MAGMVEQPDELLRCCTVKITIPGLGGWGTGFFVAPDLILTCAHVVKAASANSVTVFYPEQNQSYSAIFESLPEANEQVDLVLLKLQDSIPAHPCVYLDEAIALNDPLYSYGYPDNFSEGAFTTFESEALTGGNAFIKFKAGQVRPGMSGSPLLNQSTGKVCGIVKFTLDRSIALGGGAIPTHVILDQFPQLRELQREFHQSDRRWSSLLTKQSAIDFQPYLRSIINNEDYRDWQEVYTPTTVEDRKRSHDVNLTESPQPKFSRRLKLRVETVKPRELQGSQRTESTERREQVEQLDVLAGLRKYAPDHVLLIGKPGSGKSTSLERLLWEEADDALKQAANAKIPVLVKLRRCTGTIEALIQDFFRGHQLPLAIAEIETLLDRGKLLLLLDGLNELPEAFRTALANFRDRYRATTPMIVSTRELSIGGNLGIAKMLKMLPLTEPQMQEFVQGYLGQEGNRLFQQLKGDRLRKFAETPLLLWMLCRVFAQNDRVPANLGLAFREFAQLYDEDIQQDAPADSREQWSKLLRHLAFALMHDREPTDFRLSMPKEEAEDRLTNYLQQEGRANAREYAERWLKDLLSYHLIQPVIQPNFEKHIEFRHQLIQEYYAAEYLLRMLPTLSDEQLKRDYLNFLKWTEPIALMLAMVEEEAQALRVVKLAMDDVDLMLGARLAGEVKVLLRNKTIGYINNLQIPNRLKVRFWEVSCSEAAVPKLLEIIEDKDKNVRRISARILGKIGSEAAIPALLKAAEDRASDVRSSAYWALEQIGSEVIIPILLKDIYDPNPDIRMRAAEALGRLGNEKVISVLLKAIDDPEPDVRWSATGALGRVGNEEVIPVLQKITEDLDPDVRWQAAQAMAQIGNEIAIPALLNIIKEQYPDLRLRAAWALGKIGNETVIPVLERYAFYDPDLHVRSIAKNSLEKIVNGEKTVPAMPLTLEEENENFVDGFDGWYWDSVNPKELDYTEGEAAIPRLLNSIQDPDRGVRLGAAKAIGQIGSPVPITDLWQLHLRQPEGYLEKAISTIQTGCKFYNYEIAHGLLPSGE